MGQLLLTNAEESIAEQIVGGVYKERTGSLLPTPRLGHV